MKFNIVAYTTKPHCNLDLFVIGVFADAMGGLHAVCETSPNNAAELSKEQGEQLAPLLQPYDEYFDFEAVAA